MRKTCLLFSLVFLSALCLLSLTSCSTTKTVEPEIVTVTEYVPMKLDLQDVIYPVIQMRPDNSQLKIKTEGEIQSVYDIVDNSLSYLKAWGAWQSYAETLEKTLQGIQDTYGN